MSILNTTHQYGKISILLHWAIAIFVFLALATGFALDASGSTGQTPLILHLLSGGTAAFLTILRLVWKLLFENKLPPYPSSSKPQAYLIRWVKIFLLFLPAGIAISGIGMMVTSGLMETLPHSLPVQLPDFDKTLPRTPHGLGVKFLIALLVLHLSGALLHFWKRDRSTPNRLSFRQQNLK